MELCGIHVESCGFHGEMMWNPCGIHGRCVWNPWGNVWNPWGNVWNPWGNVWNPWGNVWNPCGDLWNRTIPPGIHLECGGRVNYWTIGLINIFIFLPYLDKRAYNAN